MKTLKQIIKNLSEGSFKAESDELNEQTKNVIFSSTEGEKFGKPFWKVYVDKDTKKIIKIYNSSVGPGNNAGYLDISSDIRVIHYLESIKKQDPELYKKLQNFISGYFEMSDKGDELDTQGDYEKYNSPSLLPSKKELEEIFSAVNKLMLSIDFSHFNPKLAQASNELEKVMKKYNIPTRTEKVRLKEENGERDYSLNTFSNFIDNNVKKGLLEYNKSNQEYKATKDHVLLYEGFPVELYDGINSGSGKKTYVIQPLKDFHAKEISINPNWEMEDDSKLEIYKKVA